MTVRQQKQKLQRQDPVARALARIVAVADLIDDTLPDALREALNLAAQALAERDSKYRAKVLVLGGSPAEAGDWVERNRIPDGAACTPVADADELRTHTLPFTLILLPGADSPDNWQWPRAAAQIAALGPKVDLIRIGRRPAGELAALKPADDA